MSGSFIFEVPAVWLAGLPLAALLGVLAWSQRRRGMSRSRVKSLLVLRAIPILLLLFLVARPVRLSPELVGPDARPVLVLLDRSESMSLREAQSTRYERALDFLRVRLLPALNSVNLPVQGMLFDDGAESVSGEQMAATRPTGKRTNLGSAIVQAVSAAHKPLAVIALTDGMVNESNEDNRAMRKLVDASIPFIGVGFGSDEAAQTLSLQRVDAPATVAPKTDFNISTELEIVNAQQPVNLDLLLFRDGQMAQRKTLRPGTGSRTWLESFRLNEAAEGIHKYEVQLLAPDSSALRSINLQGGTSVRISDESELRILYVQGAMTWDYKFIALSLRGDPAIKITGLTRTSQHSVFRQNIESATELKNGFPASLEELSTFRVVVLTDVRPEDLNSEQQEMLARFCGELGGGVLMMGGAATFNSSWQNSRLEKLLPVRFAASQSSGALEREFHIQLSPEALQHPAFRLADNQSAQELWSRLPAFSQFGRVDAPKKGAQVWMTHPTEQGPQGRRILMASQPYGSGQSAVVCLQNFWRWRLAKDSDPAQFDRFWRQLFRWLGQAGRQQVDIRLVDQELRPQRDIRFELQRQPGAEPPRQTNGAFLVRIENEQKQAVHEESIELLPGQSAPLEFHAERAGLYGINVLDAGKALVASRPFEIRERNVELDQTARNMETLKQWAGVSDGLAFKVEDCPQASDLVAQIKTKVQQVRKRQQLRHLVGLNGWTLTVLLASLTGEWYLRKRWLLI